MLRTITFKGNELVLAGRMIKTGIKAPNFIVVSGDLNKVTLADFKGKIKVITTFPSIDTSVCDLQVKEFNKRAAGYSGDVAIIGISRDLPFAQKRFCSSFGIDKVVLLSDYLTSSFGINYGVLIKELNLLARGVVILDKEDVIRYLRISEDLAKSIDYEDTLKQLLEIVKNPSIAEKTSESSSQCKACEGGIPSLPKEDIEKLLAEHRQWELVDNAKLVKQIKFKDFVTAKYFLDLVSIVAEEQCHHPTLTLMYNKLKITLTTHTAKGLTENDFIMARIIDELN